MRRIPFVFVAMLAMFLGCASKESCKTCSDIPAIVPDAAPPIESPDAAIAVPPTTETDFTNPGSYSVSESAETVSASCEMAYRLFTPQGRDAAPLVVLGHGFTRSASKHADTARFIASHGVRVATPDFCTTSDHAQNGADAAALSSAIGGGAKVIHAGYSAGGLSAVVAAAADANTVAVLGLDLVDADELGVDTAENLDIPFFGIAGEPGQCNSNNNGLAIFDDTHRTAVRVPGATHCDFENPTDGFCELLCGGSTDVVGTVEALSAAFIAWRSGVDASGQRWADPTGDVFQQLLSSGDIALP